VVFLEVMWNPLVEKQAMKARLRENYLHLPSHYIRDNEREEKHFCQVEIERLLKLMFDCANINGSH